MLLRPHERIDELYSLGIKIIQNPQVFSFSIDAVLLAYFARPKLGRKSLIIDLCSGNGAVGMFVSHKTKGKIIEVEIQPKLADMAKRSVQLNHLTPQIRVIQDDLRRVPKYVGYGTVDTVTCNPPYFRNLKTSRKNLNPYLAIAKHELKTNLTTVLLTASRLLKDRGHVYLVYRPGRLVEMLNKMQRYHLVPQALQFAYSKKNCNSQLVLIDATKFGKVDGLKILPPIITRNASNSNYSQQMRTIMFGHW